MIYDRDAGRGDGGVGWNAARIPAQQGAAAGGTRCIIHIDLSIAAIFASVSLATHVSVFCCPQVINRGANFGGLKDCFHDPVAVHGDGGRVGRAAGIPGPTVEEQSRCWQPRSG